MKKNVSKKKENDKRSINVFTSQDLLHYTQSLKGVSGYRGIGISGVSRYRPR